MPEYQPGVRRASFTNVCFAPSRPAPMSDAPSAVPAPVLHSFAAMRTHEGAAAPLPPSVQRKADIIQRDEPDDSSSGTTSGDNQAINTGLQVAGMLPGVGPWTTGALGLIGIEEGHRQGASDSKDPLNGMKQAEKYAGYVTTTAATGAGIAGFNLSASLTAAPGALATSGAAAAIGAGAAVAGAGLFGLGLGHHLSEHTEVGPDAIDGVGGIDSGLAAVTGVSQPLVRLDDYRKEQWHKGGVGGVTKSVLAGAGEGVAAVGGAAYGLGEGAYHGMGFGHQEDAPPSPFLSGATNEKLKAMLEQGSGPMSEIARHELAARHQDDGTCGNRSPFFSDTTDEELKAMLEQGSGPMSEIAKHEITCRQLDKDTRAGSGQKGGVFSAPVNQIINLASGRRDDKK